jgi:tripeptidyl-peptidase I
MDLMLAYPIIYPQTITLYNADDLLWQADPNFIYTYGFNTFLDALDGSYCIYSAFGETRNASNIGDDGQGRPVYPDPRPGEFNGPLQCGLYKPTNRIFWSYGGDEADVPDYYQKRQCKENLKLGVRGVSILFTSGDSGVSTYPPPYGIDGPTGCLGKEENIFNPSWPSTCSYVTKVRATKVYPGKTVSEPESAAYDSAGHPYHFNFSSGGRFSSVFPISDYQANAVATFFEYHKPPYPYYEGLSQTSIRPELVT